MTPQRPPTPQVTRLTTSCSTPVLVSPDVEPAGAEGAEEDAEEARDDLALVGDVRVLPGTGVWGVGHEATLVIDSAPIRCTVRWDTAASTIDLSADVSRSYRERMRPDTSVSDTRPPAVIVSPVRRSRGAIDCRRQRTGGPRRDTIPRARVASRGRTAPRKVSAS